MSKTYDPSDSPTIQHYLADFHTPFCGIMSHVNSGKTSAMCVKAQLIAANQHPDSEGVRHTAHLFIRGSHADLIRSTVRTFEQWIDPSLVNIRRSTPVQGRLVRQPLHDQDTLFPEYMVREGRRFPYRLGTVWNPVDDRFEGGEDVSGVRIGDIFSKGTFVDALFDFVPLDNPDWEATLLGTEYTCAYFDEPDSMSNIDEVLTKIPTRLGRYPSVNVAPVTCSQVNMAFNPPVRGSFTQRFFADSRNASRQLYRIPPPLLMVRDAEEPGNMHKARFVRNPDAEGVKYAGKGFKHWEDIVEANRHDADKIYRDVLGEWTYGSSGALVHTGYSRDRHVVPLIAPSRAHTLFVSLDWGAAPAALYCQYAEGGIRVIEEMGAEDTMAHEFVKEHVIPHINTEYRGYEITITGDPSGRYRRDVGEGPFEIFRDAGFHVEDDTPMDPEARWSAVNLLLRLHGGLLVAENCEQLIDGFSGKYVFKKQRNGVVLRQANKRDPITSYQDCLQAVACLVTAGYEGNASLTGKKADRYGSDVYHDEAPEEDFLWV